MQEKIGHLRTLARRVRSLARAMKSSSERDRLNRLAEEIETEAAELEHGRREQPPRKTDRDADSPSSRSSSGGASSDTARHRRSNVWCGRADYPQLGCPWAKARAMQHWIDRSGIAR